MTRAETLKENRGKLIKKLGGECAKCRSKDDLHLDHIIPVCKGGMDYFDNLQVLCKTCNLKKGKKVDWEPYFKVSRDRECIYTDRSIWDNGIMGAITPKEHQNIIKYLFNCPDIPESMYWTGKESDVVLNIRG